MSTLIEKSKLPAAVVQKIYNFELTKKFGVLKKRKGYGNVLTSGLTTLKSMLEFKDSNSNRVLFLQDDTSLEESVYSGGYGAIAAISNDERSASSTVDQLYPVEHNNVIRSGSGTGSNENAIWLGRIPERKRYNDAVTITAGRYLTDQILNNALGSSKLWEQGGGTIAFVGMSKSALDAGSYVVLAAPVIDGYQRGMPEVIEVKPNVGSNGYFTHTVNIDSSNASKMKRITHIDYFVAQYSGAKAFPDIDDVSDVAYFLERVDLNEDGRSILRLDGTLEDTGGASAPTYVEFDDDFSGWESFNMQNFHASFTASTAYTKQLGSRTENGTKVQYGLSGLANADSGQSVTVEIFPRWYTGSGDYRRLLVYDNYYRKLGSEMYTYLNIPVGDTGLDDHKYKFLAIAGSRSMAVCANAGNYAYYSPPRSYDVFPAQNEVILAKDPTGAVGLGLNQFLITYKDQMGLVTVHGNQYHEHDDNFLDFGCVGQKALLKLSENVVFGMDYQGPWMLSNLQHDFIGIDLVEWWEDNLTDAQKDACVIGYNRLKQWVMYSFPTYSTAPFTNGIVFVFDLKSFRYAQAAGQRVLPWWILKTDTPMYNFCLNEDLHLLGGSRTKVVDWNAASESENVSTLVRLKLLRSVLAGDKKTWFDRVYITMDKNASETVTINAYLDGSSSATDLSSDLNDDDNAMLRRFIRSMEVEIETASNQYDFELSQIQVSYNPRGY